MRAQVKSFSERSPLAIGTVGVVTVVVMVVAALQYQNLPFLNSGREYSAYFADAGGLNTGAGVEVSGFVVGNVSAIELHETGVLVTFTIGNDVRLGDRTEAAIKTKSLLGAKIVDVTPRGSGQLDGAIPLDRTVSPYQLPDALGDLATTISGLNTDQLSNSLATLAQTFSGTPADLKDAVAGVARFAQVLDSRDEQLRKLLDNAAQATGVLAKRTDRIVSLVKDTNALLAALQTQSAALNQIWANISAVSRQLQAFIAENRQQLQPALDKLNGVLAIVDDRKERVQQSIKLINSYVMSLGESLSSGPFFKAYVVNLFPGQFVQPFIDAAFSDLGLDPATLLPSQLTDPQTGQPGTPALPVPFPRTGQGGEPMLNLPDAITGKPGDPRYPYRQPPPAPPPGGPPPGPPALPPPELASIPEPTPSPVYVPAPGEAPPVQQSGVRP
ncbi:virulence factor Mce family protein [Mycolicibacterium rhodesiae NBB3]|uniref:Virulence factor Mce family protein n=1 Tax=Mycolicibacterium rhodesiae (strain NBB3) TaxID=710685 RepID=G8RIH1_MYCRN|nr:virulence factor Mce family protein [Mycolicibacterium rhodesiae NBB3]